MTQRTYQSGILFNQAYRLVRTRIYEVLEPFGLNPSYWSILDATLAAPEGIRLATVAKIMDVKAPLITMLSNDLIEMGLIKRVPHHSDKRAKLLVITPLGRKVCQEIEQKVGATIAQLLNGLKASEIQTFQKALGVIIENASTSGE